MNTSDNINEEEIIAEDHPITKIEVDTKDLYDEGLPSTPEED